MNEEEVREQCVLLAEECYRMVDRIEKLESEKRQMHVDNGALESLIADMERDIFELHEESEKLKDYIDNMCGMIKAETPLKEHDRWLEDMVALGYYKPEVTDGE